MCSTYAVREVLEEFVTFPLICTNSGRPAAEPGAGGDLLFSASRVLREVKCCSRSHNHYAMEPFPAS